MTTEQAINILDPETRREALRKIPVMERVETDQEACRLAVAALRAQQDAPPPNDPLSMEELRKMDGEPVWLRGNGLNRWYIFNGFSLDGIPFFTPEIGWKPWTAYRRRAEEDMDVAKEAEYDQRR